MNKPRMTNKFPTQKFHINTKILGHTKMHFWYKIQSDFIILLGNDTDFLLFS